MSYCHIDIPEWLTIFGMMHTKRKMVKTKSGNYDLVLIEIIIPDSLTSSSWPVVVDCDWRLFWTKTINILVSSRKWIFRLRCIDSLAHSDYTTSLLLKYIIKMNIFCVNNVLVAASMFFINTFDYFFIFYLPKLLKKWFLSTLDGLCVTALLEKIILYFIFYIIFKWIHVNFPNLGVFVFF